MGRKGKETKSNKTEVITHELHEEKYATFLPAITLSQIKGNCGQLNLVICTHI